MNIIMHYTSEEWNKFKGKIFPFYEQTGSTILSYILFHKRVGHLIELYAVIVKTIGSSEASSLDFHQLICANTLHFFDRKVLLKENKTVIYIGLFDAGTSTVRATEGQDLVNPEPVYFIGDFYRACYQLIK